MADKQKSLEEAQKFLQKGNYARVIQCYEDALKADPEDERTLLRLGEAQQKANDNGGAFASYTRLAQQHTRNGFLLKATALYKRALALQPRDVDTHSRLADLYQQLGLVTDAMSFLYAATKLLQENQDQDGTLKVLERMAGLEPNNVGIRIKIAEHWTKQEKPDKAVEEFRKAAKMLKELGREEDYLKVVERILYFRPDELPLTQEIVRVYLARGDSRRSLAKLQHAARLDPRDTETLGLLAQTFEALQQPEKAHQVLREKARIHEFREEGEASMDCWQRILVYQPDDPGARQRLGLDDPKAPSPLSTPSDTLPSPPPPSIRASRAARAIPAHTPQPDDLRLLAQQQQALEEKRLAEQRQEVERLLTETDVYIRYNLHDRATDHLRKVFLLDPNNLDAMERMKQIHFQSGYYPQAVDELLRMAKLAALTDRARALSYLREAIQLLPDHPETVEVGQQLGFTREEVFPQFFNGSLQHLAHALPDDESVDHLFSQLGAEIDGGALEGASPLMSYGEASPQEVEVADEDDIEVEIEDDPDDTPAPPPARPAPPPAPPAFAGLGLRRAPLLTPPPAEAATQGAWSPPQEDDEGEDSLAGVMLDPSDDNRAALVPSDDLAALGAGAQQAPEEDFVEVVSEVHHLDAEDHASLVDLSELDDLDDAPPQAPQDEDEDDLILMDDEPEEAPPQEVLVEDELSASLGFDPSEEPPLGPQDHMFSPASIAELDSLDAGEDEDEDDGDLILMDEDIPAPKVPSLTSDAPQAVAAPEPTPAAPEPTPAAPRPTSLPLRAPLALNNALRPPSPLLKPATPAPLGGAPSPAPLGARPTPAGSPLSSPRPLGGSLLGRPLGVPSALTPKMATPASPEPAARAASPAPPSEPRAPAAPTITPAAPTITPAAPTITPAAPMTALPLPTTPEAATPPPSLGLRPAQPRVPLGAQPAPAPARAATPSPASPRLPLVTPPPDAPAAQPAAQPARGTITGISTQAREELSRFASHFRNEVATTAYTSPSERGTITDADLQRTLRHEPEEAATSMLDVHEMQRRMVADRAKPATPSAPQYYSAPPAVARVALVTPPVQAPPPAPVEVPEGLAEELKEVEFYLKRGMRQEAEEMLRDLLESWPQHPALLNHLSALSGGAPPQPSAPLAKAQDPTSLTELLGAPAPLPTASQPSAPPAPVGGLRMAPAPLPMMDDDDKATLVREAPRVGQELAEASLPSLVPQDEEVSGHFELGLAYREMGLLDDALQELQAAVQEGRQVAEANFLLGQCYLDMGDPREAAGFFKEANRFLKDGADLQRHVFYRLGLCYERLDEATEAAYFFQKLGPHVAQFPDALFRLQRLKR